jgi:hypothetical protein
VVKAMTWKSRTSWMGPLEETVVFGGAEGTEPSNLLNARRANFVLAVCHRSNPSPAEVLG